MNPVAEYLNRLPEDEAGTALARCCGAPRWVARMLAARPFSDDAALIETSDRVWWSLAPEDWREALGCHPRIGERTEEAWSRREQAGVAAATGATREALVAANRAYEERFRHVFLICATGRSAADMLSELRHRLANDPGTELRVAAAEQAKITRLRLEKLVTA